MLGFLNQQKDETEDNHFNMNIDQVIKNARVANYSFSKGIYQFSKGNFNTSSEENKVKLDDPDFWKKVFKDEQTVI